jgi:hypothetical protein
MSYRDTRPRTLRALRVYGDCIEPMPLSGQPCTRVEWPWQTGKVCRPSLAWVPKSLSATPCNWLRNDPAAQTACTYLQAHKRYNFRRYARGAQLIARTCRPLARCATAERNL